MEDLVQEGAIGLLHAIDMFDPTQGFRFLSYAKNAIDRRMILAIKQSDIIRKPLHAASQLIQIKRAASILEEKLGRQTTYEEIAQEAGESEKKVKELLIVDREQHILSLEEEVKVDPTKMEDDQPLTRYPETRADITPDHSASVEDEVEEHVKREIVEQIVRELPELLQKVIQLRFGFYDGESRTLAEVASKLGLSRERIRQLEAKTLRLLWRRYIEEFLLDFHYRF